MVKNKSGDLTDAENYRAIMISNAITKLLEFVLHDKLVTASSEDVYQFGFKAKHCTGLCTGILNRTINYMVVTYFVHLLIFRRPSIG